MGQVFLARSPGGRPVVVKVILPEYASDAEYRARFAREVEAARRVGGFHTAQVVDADPTADPPWMATAYVPGPSLRQAVTERGPLRDRNLRTLAAGLVEGLAAIHARDLVHRDFKPSNIILAADGPRVIDFGVARPLDGSSMTQSGAVIGTLAYMSPEQVGGGQVGQASDVFSLGTVLAFAATGRSPYMADSIGAIVARIVGPPPELTELPDDLRELIHACWEQDPDRRPTTAELLARLSTDQTGDDWPPSHLADLIGSVLSPGVVTSPNPSITAVESPEPHGPPELPRQHGPPLPDRPPDPEDGAEGSPDNLGPAVPQEGSPESPGPTVPQEDIPENPGPAVPQEGIPDSPGPTVPQEDIPGKPGPAVPKPGWSPPLVRPPRWKRLLRERRSLVGAAVTATVLGVAASLLVWLWTSSGLYSGEAPAQTGAPSGPAEWSGLTEPRVLDVGDQVLAVAFSPDGSVLASGGADGAVRLWKAGDGEEAAVLEGHADWVRSVAFSPDGSLLASASDDRTVSLLDTAGGEERN
ncbi:MAG TPA: protein kinase, partial [Thermobifida alba]|nr:protein kinase [Thermobifida alba]